MKKIDVIIIGAGTAGLAARKQVAKKTKDYLIIDHGPLGTTCTRVGCMPSKSFIEAANIFHQHKKFTSIGASGTLRLSSSLFMKHVRKLRDHYVDAVLKEMRTWQKNKLISGAARFVAKNQVQVNGVTYQAKRIIVATGSHPVMPTPWKPLGLLTTENIFELKHLPRTLAVIGSGPIGLELGQALARAGVKVTMFGEAKNVGGLTDPKVVACALKTFKKEFKFVDAQVELILKTKSGFKITSANTQFAFENILVAIGRKPNVNDLGFQKIGFQLADNGLPKLTRDFRIPGTRISLAGDVNAFRPLLHEAANQGYSAGRNVLLKRKTKFAITFCSPNICSLGTSRSGLIGQKKIFVTGAASFENQGRAVAKLENAGLIHIFAEKRGGRLLGAEFFCPEGEHLAHLLVWAMELKLTVSDVLELPFYHPTLEEGLRTALRNCAKLLK